MITNTTAIQKNTEKEMSFVPFGAADHIKLSVAIIQNIVCVPTKTGKVCSDRDALKFMMLCQAQRLNPFAGDAFLVGYDNKSTGQAVFSLITAHQTFLKRAETCSDFEGMESGIILVDENNIVTEREGDFKLQDEICVGGWARVYRKGRKPTYRRLAIAAMIPPYDTPFWNAQKAPGQITKCAESDALRSTFPTLLGGLYSEGEMTAVIDVSPTVKSPDFGPSDGSPKRKAITQAKTAEQPAKTPQDAPNGQVSHSEPSASGNAAPAAMAEGGQQESEAGGQSQDGDLGPKTTFVAKSGESEELSNLRYLMFQSHIEEQEVVAYCKTNKLLKENQSALSDLATAKLAQLAKAWPNVTPLIKGV